MTDEVWIVVVIILTSVILITGLWMKGCGLAEGRQYGEEKCLNGLKEKKQIYLHCKDGSARSIKLPKCFVDEGN